MERAWKEPLSLSQIPRRKYVIQGDHMSTKLHSALYLSSSHPRLSHHDLSSCLRLLGSKSTLANFLYASLFLTMTLFPNSLNLTQRDPSSTALASTCPSSGLLLPCEKPRGRGHFKTLRPLMFWGGAWLGKGQSETL